MPCMDQFAAIRVFLRIVEAGSLTRAAIQLDLPKSTTSKLLAELEQHLGVKLLQRSTRAWKLTAEGAAYYRQVGPLMQQLSDADGELTARGASPRGAVRVDVHSGMANSILIPLLHEFRTLHPEIELVVGISDRPISLIEEAADCAIRLGRLPDASLIARVIYDDHLVTCASPEYLRVRGTPEHPEALPDRHQFVGYFSALSGQTSPLVFRRGQSVYQFDHAQIRSNDSTGHLNMVLAGLGIGQCYESTARAHLQRGALVPILDDWTAGSAPVSVVYPPTRKLNRRVRAFIDWIVERLAQESRARFTPSAAIPSATATAGLPPQAPAP